MCVNVSEEVIFEIYNNGPVSFVDPYKSPRTTLQTLYYNIKRIDINEWQSKRKYQILFIRQAFVRISPVSYI